MHKSNRKPPTAKLRAIRSTNLLKPLALFPTLINANNNHPKAEGFGITHRQDGNYCCKSAHNVCFHGDQSVKRNNGGHVFDTDNKPVKVDNCCKRTMPCCKDDFIASTLKPVKRRCVSGFGGSSIPITHQGTIK
jgi:hypothetical protein